MTTQTQQTLPPSIFPARFQILSGSALKLKQLRKQTVAFHKVSAGPIPDRLNLCFFCY